jgi:myo-inositol-1(or 4)-monophosphatase
MTDATQRAAVAERAARAGGVVAREAFRGDLSVRTKDNKNDLVTEVDLDAQRQVVSTIRQAFPDDTFVCEEAAEPMVRPNGDAVAVADAVPEAGAAWIVDPIDGTANFARGMRFWGTSVAAVVDGAPVGVATVLPAEGDAYTAGPDSVSRNGEPMRVSERTDPETFAVGLIGWWPRRASEEYTATFRAAAERFGDVRRLGCMQGMLALVAAGSLEAAFMPSRPHPWDAVAGVSMVRTAGGVATDIDGDPWTPDSTGLVVSNDTAHDEVLAAARAGSNIEATD